MIAAEELNNEGCLPASFLKPTTVDVEKWFFQKYGKDAASAEYLISMSDENGIIGEQTANEMMAEIKFDAALNESRWQGGHFEEYLSMIEKKQCSVADLIFMIYCSVAFFNSCRLLRDEARYRSVEFDLLFYLEHEPVVEQGDFLALVTDNVIGETNRALKWHISQINSGKRVE